jgi:hypothetical protein
MTKSKSVFLKEPKVAGGEGESAPCLYTTFGWGGTVRYQCGLCAVDVGSEELILAHIDQAHTVHEEPAPASGLVEITEEDVKMWTEQKE